MPLYKYSFDFGKIHTIEANIRQVLYTQGKQVYQFPLALKFAVNAEFLSKTFLCKGYRFFRKFHFVGLSNILDREGGENLSGSSPMKRTHGTGVAPTLVGS